MWLSSGCGEPSRMLLCLSPSLCLLWQDQAVNASLRIIPRLKLLEPHASSHLVVHHKSQKKPGYLSPTLFLWRYDYLSLHSLDVLLPESSRSQLNLGSLEFSQGNILSAAHYCKKEWCGLAALIPSVTWPFLSPIHLMVLGSLNQLWFQRSRPASMLG